MHTQIPLKNQNTCLLLSHSALLEHGENLSHPENRHRLQAIIDEIQSSRFASILNMNCERMATYEELQTVHAPSYIDSVFAIDGKDGALDAETLLSKGSVRAARLAAGLGLELIESIILGKVKNGFALVRPPGHHACPAVGMGFCIFNNIALAATKALNMGLKRVAIVDWDVHHGNGTQETFYERDSVLLIDLHQDDLFPKNSGNKEDDGIGKGSGFTMNFPLPAGGRDVEYYQVFEKAVIPALHRYRPQLILVSAGFDAHESDPLGMMNVTTQGYQSLAKLMKTAAEKLCEGRLAFFLEGGYNPFFLAKNVLQCVEVLAEENETIN